MCATVPSESYHIHASMFLGYPRWPKRRHHPTDAAAGQLRPAWPGLLSAKGRTSPPCCCRCCRCLSSCRLTQCLKALRAPTRWSSTTRCPTSPPLRWVWGQGGVACMCLLWLCRGCGWGLLGGALSNASSKPTWSLSACAVEWGCGVVRALLDGSLCYWPQYP